MIASTQRPGAEEYKSAGASAVIMSRLNSEQADERWPTSRTRSPAAFLTGALAERKNVGLDSRSEEGDLECAVGDRPPLANQLIEPLL